MTTQGSPSTSAKQTFIVSLLSLGGMVSGLLNSVVVAYFYGATVDRDAYLLASVVPMYVISVFSGNLSLLFIPIFIDHHTRSPQRAWRIASTVVLASGLGLALLVGVVELVPTRIVAWISSSSLESQVLSASLLRVLMPAVFFSAISSFFSSLLYATRRFALASAAPIVSSLVALIANIALHGAIGVHSLAFGFTLGALISLLMTWKGARAAGFAWSNFDFRDSDLGRIARASMPLVVASLLYRFNGGFERIIGSGLTRGSISYVTYATQIVVLLSTLTSAGIATTVFPMLASSWSMQNLPEVRRYLAIAVRSILLVALPVAAWMAVMGRLCVRILLERGAFDGAATEAVYACLLALMIGYVAASLGNAAARCFYVTQRTTPLAVYTVFETLIYVGLCWWLSGAFSFVGLAAATTARDVVSVVVYFFAVSRMFHGIGTGALLRDAGKVVAATALCALALYSVRQALAERIPDLLVVGLAALVAVPIYLYCTMRVFRIEEAARLFAMLASRLPFLARFAQGSSARKEAS